MTDCGHWHMDNSQLPQAKDVPRQVYVVPCKDCDGSQYYVPEGGSGYRVFDIREQAEEHLLDGYYEPVYAETVDGGERVVRNEWHPPYRLRFEMAHRKARRTAARAKCFDGIVELNPAMFRNGNDMQETLKCILHELAHLHVGPRAHHNAQFRERCEELGGSRHYDGSLESDAERAERRVRAIRRRVRRNW